MQHNTHEPHFVSIELLIQLVISMISGNNRYKTYISIETKINLRNETFRLQLNVAGIH